ncbi:MAG: hypothetical protein KGS72_29180, partial [Cyanobacteria bacterium REEB67]|nr:hypothetical protein [Cyanobacteria bacterium REEB67]
MNPLQKLNLSAIVILTMMVTAAFVPDVWICDLLSQFRLVFAALLFASIVLSLVVKEPKSILLSLLAFAINATPIAPLLAASAPPPDRAHNISVLNFNTQFPHNDKVSLLETLINDKDPDVITL